MDREQRIALQAFGDVLRERLAALQPGSQRFEVPAPQVHVRNDVDMAPVADAIAGLPPPAVTVNNQPAQVVVNVDMRPVAEALNGIGEMFSQLLQVLAEPQPRPVVNVAPNVTVEPARMPRREKRVYRIEHEDGSVSTVTEG